MGWEKFVNFRTAIVQERKINNVDQNWIELGWKKFINRIRIYRIAIMQQMMINNFNHNWIELGRNKWVNYRISIMQQDILTI